MTAECQRRFVAFIKEALLVREFQVLDERVADERARNIATGVEAEFFVTCREEPPCGNGGNESNEGSPGSGSSGPVSTAGRSTGSRTGEGSGRGVGTAAASTADHLALGTDNWRFR